MSTVADYVGRKVDVLAFRNTKETVGVEKLLGQALADPGTGGEVATGIQKLAQRFLLMLLTEPGSLRYLPDAGCQFMIDARKNRWRTSTDVSQSFYFSLLDVKRQMRLLETPDDPPDEVFADAVLLGVVLSPIDRAVVRIELSSAAGTTRRFIAPIDTVTNQ